MPYEASDGAILDLSDLDELEHAVLPRLRAIVEQTAKTQTGDGDAVSSAWLVALSTYMLAHNGLAILRRLDALADQIERAVDERREHHTELLEHVGGSE